jgi:competence protein ComEA
MLKRIAVAIACCLALMGRACAQVDANRADASALESVRGIGPATAQRIVEERQANGPYRDWTDFERRVRGIGGKRAAALSGSGLTVDGQALPGASAASGKRARQDAASTSSAPSPTVTGPGQSPNPRTGTTANPFNDPAERGAGKSGPTTGQ